MARARVLLQLLLALALLRVEPVRAEGSAAAGQPGGGFVLVELVVEDAKGVAIVNLKPDEVVVEQDGERQRVASLEYQAACGCYALRYLPPSGRAGAVAIRILRGGSRVRGRDAPQVKPRWIPPVPAFELPLRAALEALEPPSELDFELEVLRFETRDDTLHHAFVADLPVRQVQVSEGGAEARLAFLLRVRSEAGREVHQGSLEQSIGLAGSGDRRALRFVWSDHVHLLPGRYQAELAVMDTISSRRSVRRLPLSVEAWPSGLRVSSVTFLLGADGLMRQGGDDDPFVLEDASLVPMLRPSIGGSEGRLFVLAFFYPDRTSGEPVRAVIELHRDGVLRGKAQVPLPAPEASGRIRYLGGLGFKQLQPGAYELRLVATQGQARAEEKAVLRVTEPLRVN